MKNLLFIACIGSMLAYASCQESKPVRNCATFTEMSDPTTDTLSDWSMVKKGLHASFGSIDVRYPKSVAPEIIAQQACGLTGWRGERLSAQLVLWTTEPIQQVACTFSEFKSPEATLPASIAQARFVRYVMTDIFEPGCGYRKPEDFPASLSADMLDSIGCMDMDAKTVRPVWISIDIPAEAKQGNYKGTLTVDARNAKPQQFEIDLKVQAALLPPATAWEYYLDLWQHPTAVARVENLKVWSDEHFAAMKPLMQLLAGAGQKVITATLNKDPWNGQCFDRYEDMIAWTKNADNSWTYDYAVFDRWIQFMMDLGIKKRINCYSMIPWNNELHYKDVGTGELITVKADPGTKVFEELWTPFLLDFVKHQKAKGWLEITNIAMDERSPETMKATLGLLQKVAPELGVALADNHKSYKQYPFIDDMCVAWGSTIDAEDLAQRKAKGLTSTFYVCCSHGFPNVFTFSAPAEAVYSAWYSTAAGLDGYLRWAYNSWVEHPLTDSRFRTWPGGDTYIVYPGARSSIRFERLREGIQDAEKIRQLRKDLSQVATPESMEKLARLNSAIQQFNTTETPTVPCQDLLNPAKELLNQLAE